MSESDELQVAPSGPYAPEPVTEAVPTQAPPVAFSTFASILRPQPIRDEKGAIVGLNAGHPNEIWLKFLNRMHGMEKHTVDEWNALIDKYGAEPAHPSVTGG